MTFDTDDQMTKIIQMNDGNIIINGSQKIKIVNLKEESFEVLQEIDDSRERIVNFDKLIIIGSNEGFGFVFYTYENGKLTEKKRETNKGKLYDFCAISKEELALYYYKDGKIFGWNAFLQFYDISIDEQIKTLKLGDGEYGGDIKFANKKTLLLSRNFIIVIIDVKNRDVKREIKFDNNHLLQHNINDYNTIKTFVNKKNNDDLNYNTSEATKDFIPQIKTNFNTIENINTNSNTNKLNNNKLLLSNDSLKNDILLINKNTIENNSNTKTLNNLFYRSNSNTIQKKGRKLKLGLQQQSDLNLDINNKNYNSIEANRNYNNTIKNKRHIIYSLNIINSKAGSDNELNNYSKNLINIEENAVKRFNKNKHYLNNVSSSPSSLYKDAFNKNLIDENNSVNLVIKKDKDEKFDYKENFEKLKQRMNKLVDNLFDLIENKNKK